MGNIWGKYELDVCILEKGNITWIFSPGVLLVSEHRKLINFYIFSDKQDHLVHYLTRLTSAENALVILK